MCWKSAKVRELLEPNFIVPKSMVDVGCGAGGVLMQMMDAYPNAKLTGYDIAPDAERFWTAPRDAGINLVIGNFIDSSVPFQDLILLLDVVEHLQDPFSFLSKLKGRAKHYVFHFPLDLSAVSVLRESPLLFVRDKVGHVHYYTRGLVLALLKECGYRVVEAKFTGAAFNAPGRGWKTTLAQIPRRLAFAVNHDWGARLFGGETLIVLAVDADAK
jgi:SAM-dependent methyltransferase